jgi:hypothetical protein
MRCLPRGRGGCVAWRSPSPAPWWRAATQHGALIHAVAVSERHGARVAGRRWNARRNNDELNPAFGNLSAADFDVVRLGWR